MRYALAAQRASHLNSVREMHWSISSEYYTSAVTIRSSHDKKRAPALPVRLVILTSPISSLAGPLGRVMHEFTHGELKSEQEERPAKCKVAAKPSQSP
jgi:hypothetical protein